MMWHEANATKLLASVMSLLKDIQQKLKSDGASEQLVEVYMTETKSLMERMPDLIANADAKADQDLASGILRGKERGRLHPSHL